MPSWGGHTPGVETQFAVNYLGLSALLARLEGVLAYGIKMLTGLYWS